MSDSIKRFDLCGRLNSYDYRVRKQARVELYKKFIEGWKLKACTACNGSGIYDHNGSPPCGACDGTGKERYNSKENQN
jgi:hypothetical protein